MRFEQIIRQPKHLLLKCISGSRAYNLQVASSDTDIKGIFVSPQKELYGLQYTKQVSNETNDEVYIEIGRFVELLCKNNPNILELLSSSPGAILYRHPLMDLLRPEDFLSMLCLDTFAGYAKTQIKKARGLNKKINRPLDEQRKAVTDFCYVIKGNGSVRLNDWLQENSFKQGDCGLVNLPHFRDVYLLYHNSQVETNEKLKGIVSGELANDVQLSPTPKDIVPLAVMNFNKDGYSVYCKEYNEYWQWAEQRNQARYQNTLSHGKNYDSKNMMHTFRLLALAEEIALYKKVIVHREDRDFLLRVRNGEFEYEELMEMVEEKMKTIEDLYQRSGLPEAPDVQKAEELLVMIREEFYGNVN
jgi:predicted nucleotidyltransferase